MLHNKCVAWTSLHPATTAAGDRRVEQQLFDNETRPYPKVNQGINLDAPEQQCCSLYTKVLDGTHRQQWYRYVGNSLSRFRWIDLGGHAST
mmetsp:Transcript_5648/g.15861  ORF Transcript_5648/g.15861 Transcript_5648/m.15861 type:complete len:91 (+) Transcript_5648:1399-1671(+)